MQFSRFFYRLLGAFLITAFIPAACISLSFEFLSRSVLEKSLLERSDSAAQLVAGSLTAFLDSWAASLHALSGDPALIEYFASAPDKRSDALTDEVQRRINALGREDRINIYVIPQLGKSLGTTEIPESYSNLEYRPWGILGALERGTNRYRPLIPGKEQDSLSTLTIFGKPHIKEDSPTVIALGRAVPATPRPEGPAGIVLIDIKRSTIAEFLPTARDAFTGLMLVDSSDCILFDMSNSFREGSFIDGAPYDTGTRIDRDSSRIVAVAELGSIRLIAYQPLAPIETQSSALRTVSLASCILGLLLALILAVILSRSISNPVRNLVRSMARVEKGDLSTRLHSPEKDELGTLVKSFNSMLSRIEQLMAETIEQHQLLRNAEIRALQAKIDPHFLYNTLNTIRALAKIHNVQDIAGIATRLGKLLRSGFSGSEELTTVAEDLELARAYLEIQEIRYPDRFSFSIHMDPAVAGAPIPRLLIEPLAENAVIHGLEKREGPGVLHIHCKRSGTAILILVEDDGTSIPELELKQIRQQLADAESGTMTKTQGEGAGMALLNIQRRISILYGTSYGLSIENREERGVRVRILIPDKRTETDNV